MLQNKLEKLFRISVIVAIAVAGFLAIYYFFYFLPAREEENLKQQRILFYRTECVKSEAANVDSFGDNVLACSGNQTCINKVREFFGPLSFGELFIQTCIRTKLKADGIYNP